MATTTITLTSGSFGYEDGNIKINGQLTINDSNKLIQNINAPVMESDVQIGSFSAYRDVPGNPGNLRYNISFDDPSKGATLFSVVPAAVAAVQAELDK